MNNNIAFPDYTDGPIGRVRGYNWYRAQKQRDQQPIRGTQIAVTQNSDTPTICGRLLDSSVSAGGALGAIPINSGAVGINNLGGTAYPAPTLQGSPTLTASGTPLACDVTVQCTVNNVPQDGNVAQVMWLFRRNGTTTWTPWAEVPLSGLPYPQASQAISFGFGQLQAGLAYDFGIAYISARGDLGAITAVSTNYAVTAVSIPSSYMLGGTAINPAVGSLTNNIGASTNGISTPCTINWTCTNQPTDGSLSRVAIWFRQAQAGATVGSSGTAQAGAWAYYASLPAVGVNLASPPASASYSFVFTDLANGISYDFGFSYENAQGGETNVTAGFVGITMPNVLAQNKMPSAQMNNGPQLTVTLQSPLTGAGTANPIAVVGATIGDWTANNAPSWFLGLRTFLRVHGQTTYQNVGDITPGQAVTFNTQVALGAAQAWDIGFAYLDNAGNVSTIVWPAALSNINAPAVGPTGINSLGGPNLVPDSGFNYANFNGSGIAGNDPYWNFYLIDGASFFIGRGSGNGNYLGVRPGDSNKTCKAQSEVMVAQANTLYTVSAYIDATTCSGANQPYISLVSTDQSVEYARASQTIGKNGIVSAQYTTPASGGPTQFTVMFNSNNCTINSSILVFAQPMLQVGNLGPYTPGPSVSGGAPSGTGNNPPPAGGSGGGAADPGSGSGDGGGYHKNKTMSYQVRGVVADTAAADNSYLQTGVISGRHFLGGNANDTSAFVDSSSNLLYGRHHVSVRTALSSSAGADGSYLNSSQIYDRHISSVKLDTISDGTTYQRMPTANMDANRRALIDFTQSHVGKNIDNIAEGTTNKYFNGKTLDNLPDGSTYASLPVANIAGTGTAKRALIDFTQSHVGKNLDNIADGATYGALPLANITGTGTAKRALIDFTQAHIGKTIDNVSDGTSYKRVAFGAFASGSNSQFAHTAMSTLARAAIDDTGSFTAQPKNLIYNGGFAIAPASGTYATGGTTADANPPNPATGPIPGWRLFCYGSGAGDTAYVAAGTNGGGASQYDNEKADAYAGYIQRTTTASGSWTGFAQRFAVAPGQWIAFRMWVFVNNLASCHLKAAFYKNDGTNVIQSGTASSAGSGFGISNNTSDGSTSTTANGWSGNTYFYNGPTYLNRSTNDASGWKLAFFVVQAPSDAAWCDFLQMAGNVASGSGTPGQFYLDNVMVVTGKVPMMFAEAVNDHSFGHPAMQTLFDAQGRGYQVEFGNGAYRPSPNDPNGKGGYEVVWTPPDSTNVMAWDQSLNDPDLNHAPLTIEMTGWVNSTSAGEFGFVCCASGLNGNADPQNGYLIRISNANVQVFKKTSGGAWNAVINTASGQNVGWGSDKKLVAVLTLVNGNVRIAVQWAGQGWLIWTDTSSPLTSGNFGLRNGTVTTTFLREFRLSNSMTTAHPHLLGSGVSSIITNQGSIPPCAAPGISITASNSSGNCSTTISWSAGTVYAPDNTSISIAAGSWSQSGLSASTTYHYSVYADTSGTVHVLGNYGAGAAPNAQQKYQVYLDGRFPITEDCYITTPATSGGGPTGGGGGGGGSCPSLDQIVRVKELGYVKAREYRVGMHLMGPDGKWKKILRVVYETSQMFRVTVAGETYEVDANHYWQRADGEFVKAPNLTLNTLLRGADGAVYPIDKIAKGRVKKYAKTQVEGGVFVIGRLIGHNAITL